MSKPDDAFTAVLEGLRLETEEGDANKEIFLELPDNDQVLFLQQGEDSQDFPLFADLPVEIRRMIWKECLPNPRSVNISMPCQSVVCHRRHWKPQTKARRYPIPITLHINSESRQETMRNYIAIPWETVDEEKGKVAHLLVIDLKRDTVYLRCCCVVGPISSDLDKKELSRWIKFLQKVAPKNAMKNLARIEIRGFSTIQGITDLMQKFPDTNLEKFKRVGAPALAKEVVLNGLLLFTGLKHVKVNLWVDTIEISQRDLQAVVESSRKKILDFLEKHKGRFVGGKVPEVVVEGRVGLYWAGITDNW